MFCSKCGYRIKKGSRICSNCQTPVSETEVCGGFWGLVGNNKQEPPVSSSVTSPSAAGISEQKADYMPPPADHYAAPEPRDYGKRDQEQKNFSIFPILTGVFLAAFVLAAGFGAVKTGNYKKELASKDKQIEKLSAENSELLSETDSLKEDIEDKDGQIEDLQKSVAGQIDNSVNDFQKDLHQKIREDYNKVTEGSSTQ